MSNKHRRGGWDNVVYAAEHEVWSQKRNGIRDLRPAEARSFAESVVASETWTHGPVEVRFHSKGNGSYASPTEGWITFSRSYLNSGLVLHELAHMACPAHEGHGRLFRAAYLALCDEHLPIYGPKLQRSLLKRGVVL